MKASEIVLTLAQNLPKHTNYFTTQISVSSLTYSGGVVTATTAAAHGLAVGDGVNIQGAKPPITISSLTRSGAVGTLVTATPHDFTYGVSTAAEITGATEAEFNGTFNLLSVPDRYTATFTMADAGATTATGAPLLLNGASALNQFNGAYAVASVPDTTTFTYAVTASLPATAYGTIVAHTNARITGVVSSDVIVDAYTKQLQDDIWAFVVLGDVTASKSRYTEGDAVADTQHVEQYQQRIIQPVTIYVVVPSSLENAARGARDLCEDLFLPLCRSMLFKQFSSGTSLPQRGPIHFVSHGFGFYRRAYYIHGYEFQQVVELSEQDTVGAPTDVAFRDITLQEGLDIGTGVEKLTAAIDLDGG